MSNSQEHQDTGQPSAEPPPGPYPPGAWKPRRYEIFDPQRKSTGLACFLSLMPGLGQVYLGQYQRGFVHLIVVAFTFVGIGAGKGIGLAPFLGMFLAFFWLYNIIDAGRRAALYNRAIAGGEEIELPSDLNVVGNGGPVATLVGGIVISAVGLLLLLNNLDYPMEWLEDWWAVAPIAFGLYLIAKALRDRAKRA